MEAGFLLITTTETECNGYRAPSTVETQRRVTLILALGLREGFVEEKLGLEGWRGFYRQDRGMWLSREKERMSKQGKYVRPTSGKLSKCLHEVFDFSSVYKEQ